MKLEESSLLEFATEPGIYRCSPKVNGRAIWYSVGAAGSIVAMHVASPGESEAQIAEALIIESRRRLIPKPELRLITSSRASTPSFDRALWWTIARARAEPALRRALPPRE